MRKEKVSTDDIRSIKKGTSVTFTVEHPKQILSVMAMAHRLNRVEPELKTRYTCTGDYANRKVTVTASAVK